MSMNMYRQDLTCCEYICFCYKKRSFIDLKISNFSNFERAISLNRVGKYNELKMFQEIEFERRESTSRGRILTFSIVNKGHDDLKWFFADAFHYFDEQIRKVVRVYGKIRVNTRLKAEFNSVIHTVDGPSTKKNAIYIHTRTVTVDCETNISEIYKETIQAKIMEKLNESTTIKELLVQVNSLNVNNVDVEFRESAFQRRMLTFAIVNNNHIELIPFFEDAFPHFEKQISIILREHGMIKVNICLGLEFEKIVQSDDGLKSEKQTIFINTRSSAVDCGTELGEYYKKFIQTTLLQKFDDVIMMGSGFTLCGIKKIAKFENQNANISINVYHCNEKDKRIYPIRLTKETKKNHVHLLLLTVPIPGEDSNENSENINYIESVNVEAHYCWIKDLSRAVNSQVSKNCRKVDICDRCLCHFGNKIKLEAHRIQCLKQNHTAIQMPDKCDIINFKNYDHKLKIPFVVYADVEAILKQPSQDKIENNSSTRTTHEHEVFSVGLYFHCNYKKKLSFYKTKRGPKCVEWFAEELLRLADSIQDIYNRPKPLKMTRTNDRNFASATHCHICEQKFEEYDDDRVRDHCHLTGKYRGAAHNECNRGYRDSRDIPVIFHNLSGYDSHFIIAKIAKRFKGQIDIIPINSEIYISFTKIVEKTSNDYKRRIRLKFIDSLRFMPSSLDYLSSLIPSDKKTILRNQWSHLSSEKLKLLERKGIFCYEYVDSSEKLNETSLPPKDAFYSKLYDEKVSDEDYEFAKQVWDAFDIQTLGEYSDLYLKTDVLLLADVFENFRDTCLNIYKLDPAHYFTCPGLSWDAMLYYTKVNIELLTDVDMLMFVERGTRGGIVQCCKRYIEANNKHMENFNPTKESNYLFYIDANNLYGWSMMEKLPINGFEWCDAEHFDIQQIMNLSDSSDVGYLFEVDLMIPEHLHDKFSDYPFCPENQNVPYSKNSKKLLLTLEDKKNYVIHYRMLKLALQQGLVLKRIHRALQFHQSSWLKPYIQLNTDMRTKATNEFEKNQYKLMSNSVFGKTMESQRKRVDIRLRTYWNQSSRYGARALISSPQYKRHIIFNEDLVAIEMHRTNIYMNKPIIIGMAILDISKWLMYDYNIIWSKCRPRLYRHRFFCPECQN